MISHQYKCIFIHIPKTAGSSVNKFLFNEKFLDWQKPNYEILYGWCPVRKIHLQHATPDQLLNLELISEDHWQDYYKFIFVRNPWDRAYSDYLWMKKDRNINGSFRDYILKKNNFEKVLTDRSFKEYRGDHLYSQSHFLMPHKKDFNYIGTFENFNTDIQKICEALNLKWNTQLHEKKNSNRKSHYSLFYNRSKKKLVDSIYSDDLKNLGYSYTEKKVGFDKLKNYL